MLEKKINQTQISQLLNEIITSGKRIIAPKQLNENTILYASISSNSEIAENYLLPRNSIKEFFFPRTEKLFAYEQNKEGVNIAETQTEFPETIIFGCRPCEASSLPIMDKVFTWDYEDELYLKRREMTTIISIGCEHPDEICFCTSIGGDPNNPDGSDIIFTKIHNKAEYYVRIITSKGEKFIEEYKNFFEVISDKDKEDANKTMEIANKEITNKINIEPIKNWLDNNFEHNLWQKISERCISCGTCTYLCPTCHCFDIMENSKPGRGIRSRNWDSCAFGNFTKMPVHQPRDEIYRRYRQRVMHKFKYYIDNFSLISCVGCGRCIRYCGVGMNLSEVLREIVKETEKTEK